MAESDRTDKHAEFVELAVRYAEQYELDALSTSQLILMREAQASTELDRDQTYVVEGD